MTNMDMMEGASMINGSGCTACGLGPPPNLILHIPPPPIPSYLQYGSSVGGSGGGVSSIYSNAGVLINQAVSAIAPAHINNSLCKHSCNWRTEGVQYVEMPQQGPFFFRYVKKKN